MTSIASLVDVIRSLPATSSPPRRSGDFSAQKKEIPIPSSFDQLLKVY